MKNNVQHVFSFLSVILFLLCCQTLNAQSDENSKKTWYFQGGALLVNFLEGAELSAAGNVVPDASLELSNSTLPGLQFGYHLSNNFSLSSVITIPVTTTASGTGMVEGLTVGDATIMPLNLIANYHIDAGGFQPFLGAGINYTIVTKTEDAAVLDIEADNAFGFVLRGGFDFMFSDKWGVNASALMHFIKSDLSGTVDPNVPGFGGAPITSTVDINPLVIQIGVTYKL